MEEKSELPSLSLKKPILASVCAGLGSIPCGAVYSYFGMVSTAMVYGGNTTVSFDLGDPTTFTTWFVSVPFLASLPSIFVSFWLQDTFGRKICMLVGCGVAITSWLIIINARHVWMLYTGSAIEGFAAIIFLPAVSVYVAELSPTDQRGSLLCIIEVGINLGGLLTYCVGILLHWRFLALFIMLFSALCAFCIVFLPETPRFLVFKERRNQALKSIRWFYGEISEESENKIILLVEDSLAEVREPTPWKDMLKKPLLNYLLASQMLFILQIACGFYSTRIMLTQILKSLKSNVSVDVEILVFAVLGFVGAVLCMFVVNRYRRRVLLLISSAVMVVAMATLGAYYCLLMTNPGATVDKLSWLPLLALVTSTVGYNLGLGPIPFMVLTELFPTSSRSKASVAAIFTFFLCLFVNIQMYGALSTGVGNAAVYVLSAAFSAAGFVLICYFVPETKNLGLS